MQTTRRFSPLLTDLYQLTMAYGYWKTGTHQTESVFHLFYRRQPFGGGFAVACGLADVIAYLRDFAFTDDEVSYLAMLAGNDRRPLFEPAFLDYLRTLRWMGSLDAIPEGTLVFPNEPLLRVQGPLLQCQLIETALLNFVNFQTLIATKAARVCLAAQGDPVIEFGLRRAQGPDGGLTASRAAYIGGCAATSNVLAGQLFGIPVRGTHAHSWVMSFDSERDAFAAYAHALPNNAIFLVDTYSTLDGVRHAIEAGRSLRERGFELGGIRLDSGDLAWLSIEARQLLDAAGFPKAAIVASNDLDEATIASLKQQGARINMWGVGTKLVTGGEQPALGGIYKLAAVRDAGGRWHHKVKLSEQSAKVSTPGIQQVRRFRRGHEFIGDMIFNLDGPPDPGHIIVDRLDPTRRKNIPANADSEDLLVPVVHHGRMVYQTPAIDAIRDRTRAQLASLHETRKRFLNPHEYPVGLSPDLHELKTHLVQEARGV